MGKPKKRSHTGRDYNMVSIIKGANKAYVEKDQKKEANKMASRYWQKAMDEDWADTKDAKIKCLMCGFPYSIKDARSPDEKTAMECGYCSVSCMDYHNEEK